MLLELCVCVRVCLRKKNWADIIDAHGIGNIFYLNFFTNVGNDVYTCAHLKKKIHIWKYLPSTLTFSFWLLCFFFTWLFSRHKFIIGVLMKKKKKKMRNKSRIVFVDSVRFGWSSPDVLLVRVACCSCRFFVCVLASAKFLRWIWFFSCWFSIE